MMYDSDHMTTGGWVFASFMMLLLVVLVVVAIVWLVRWTAASGEPAPRSDGGSASPREVLDRRLASGEIDEEEYGRLRAVLSDADASRSPMHASS